jgi:predicted lipoprotein with Yx(FWY)xxD motif
MDVGEHGHMRMLTVLLVALALVVAGCGGDDEETPAAATPAATEAMEKEKEQDAEAMEKPAKPDGTRITLRESEFGAMLFDAREQAIYIFENDPKGDSVCYDECAEAWPPVYTDGEPQGASGVDAKLLGTIERRDGREQVTYAGKPLYFYAHEGPGEVRCHNIDLNGGLWWVVGADGERRP